MSFSPFPQRTQPSAFFSSFSSPSNSLNDAGLYRISPDDGSNSNLTNLTSPIHERQSLKPSSYPHPDEELQIQHLQLKQEYSKLESEYKELCVELRTTKSNYESLLQIIQNNPAYTASAATRFPIPSFSQKDFPKVTIWTKQDHNDWVETSTSSRFSFLQDERGNHLPDSTVTSIRAFAKNIWQQFANSSRAPSKFTDVSADCLIEYFHYMITMYPCLGLCDDNWKAREIFVVDYGSWWSKRYKDKEVKPLQKKMKRKRPGSVDLSIDVDAPKRNKLDRDGYSVPPAPYSPSSSLSSPTVPSTPSTSSSMTRLTEHPPATLVLTSETSLLPTPYVQPASLTAVDTVSPTPSNINDESPSSNGASTPIRSPVIVATAANRSVTSALTNSSSSTNETHSAPTSPDAASGPTSVGLPGGTLLNIHDSDSNDIVKTGTSPSDPSFVDPSTPGSSTTAEDLSVGRSSNSSSSVNTTDIGSTTSKMGSLLGSSLSGIFTDPELAKTLAPPPADPSVVHQPKPKPKRKARAPGTALNGYNLCKKDWFQAVQARNEVPMEDSWKSHWQGMSPDQQKEWNDRAKTAKNSSTAPATNASNVGMSPTIEPTTTT